MAFTLISAAFAEGEDIPQAQTCDGEGRSPELGVAGGAGGDAGDTR